MKILVTGGTGFIGSHIVPRLLAIEDVEVVNLSKQTFSHDNLKAFADENRYKLVKGDISNASDVEAAMKGCNVVINFAAEASVDRSIKNAEPFVKTNFAGTYVVLDVARKLGIKKFLQISTDEVYGECLEGSNTETAQLKPSSAYAATKAAADLLALAYFKTYGLPVMVLRCSNVFGPLQFPEKIIPLFATNAIEDKQIPIYGDGLNKRDWLYVDDYIEAIVAVLEKGKIGEIYNVSGHNERTNLEVTKAILKLLEKPESLIKYVEDRKGHDRRYAVDTSKISAIGWKPKHEFDEALASTVTWYKENKAWWAPLKEIKR